MQLFTVFQKNLEGPLVIQGRAYEQKYMKFAAREKAAIWMFKCVKRIFLCFHVFPICWYAYAGIPQEKGRWIFKNLSEIGRDPRTPVPRQFHGNASGNSKEGILLFNPEALM